MGNNSQRDSTEKTINDHINTDDRNKYEWQSKWCEESSKKIKTEAIWMGALFFLSLLLMVLAWRGDIYRVLTYDCLTCATQIDQYIFIFIGGLFGGTIFGLKYLYKVVARGHWHLDRKLWRIFSPLLSAGVALAFGTLFDSGIIGLEINTDKPSGYFAIGFLTGYFADSAIAKMQEVAETLFAKQKA
ncbi:hypothetical protein [Catenovulum agarivorans]|uniref:hypothetical protein n=1 Tax=Catenovulum agarivorans TaxID=1172192 RepID=UPI0002F4952B|nr:hypothetical protein [Catenovulum agarivorans]